MVDVYKKAWDERKKSVDSILGCSSRKRIVVAGPGTGKTYLFKEILENCSKGLTLTFVNALVEDLSLGLCGLSEVRTLHGFARSVLGSATKSSIKVFPKLVFLINEDAKIMLGKDVDFNDLFYNRNDDSECLEFYKKRRDYYGKYYGYSDIILETVNFLENNDERIPRYEQVLVDEFQDFNKLEVSLIDLLARRNPILLAGDDDQALYDFKSASAEYIRERFNNGSSGYTPFSLPYCSRCTSVIVGAVNDIIDSARASGKLIKRVEKDYLYFRDEKKDRVSSSYPKISYSQIFSRKIPWFIQKKIGEIAINEKDIFSVLIISAYKKQSVLIENALRDKGFVNIASVVESRGREPALMEGFRILLNDKESNLGWRIVARYLLSEEDFFSLLKETSKDEAGKIVDLVDVSCKENVYEALKILKAVKDGKKIINKNMDDLLKMIGIDPYSLAKDFLKSETDSGYSSTSNLGISKLPIKLTTIQGSKGLSADYVFITHFDDRYFIGGHKDDQISDRDICNFLVTITRAKKKVFLISSNTKKEPTFLRWINSDRLEKKNN